MKNNNAFPCRKNLLRGAVATILGTSFAASYTPQVWAQQQPQPTTQQQQEAKAASKIEEVVVTGSRIVRRDLETNSPLLTIDKQQLEDSSFISVKQALNELPQFMAGGALNGSSAVSGLQAANGLDGGRGSGDMFNSSLLPDNAGGIGIVVPGAASVNLRGLGANRSLTLIDGHRAMPINASMTVDLNSIPTIAIGGMEVITGGASAVYGADALAGVTNIKFRDKFEGMEVRVRAGANEAGGDGQEMQYGALFGASVGEGKGHVMVGMEYSKREAAYWKNRDFLRAVQDSPYSTSGDYIFGFDPSYTVGAGTGSYNFLQKAWSGNSPTQAAVNTVFADRNCKDSSGALLNCVATGGGQNGGFIFQPDGTLYARSTSLGAGASTLYYGPQSYNKSATASIASPDEVTCGFASPVFGAAAAGAPFAGQNCNPTVNRADYGRWLSSPRDAYNLFGRATYQINDSVEAFSDFHFASSNTFTRREPAPFSGNFAVVIPYHTAVGGDAVYLPSLVPSPVASAGQVPGQTKAEFLAGGTRGTSCAPVGGCTMSQAFPVPAELRTLLDSRATSLIGTTGANAQNPFRGLNACNDYTLATNLPAGSPGVLTNPNGGAQYIVNTDPNTGQPLSKCGPNSGWALNQQPSWMPVRGTADTESLYQVSYGLRGNLPIKDWTWELYGSVGQSETQTKFIGFASVNTYQRILAAPNYGKGYIENGTNSKYITCTSGLNPFDFNLKVSQDCLDAIVANELDRNSMSQQIWEVDTQGGILNLPGGELRGSLGASYRKNAFKFTPDPLHSTEYITDYSPGSFGSGSIDQSVDVKEVYGELLVPLLKDKPLIKTLELELGARSSSYSTGQDVSTYKIEGSWAPTDWMRFRGGFNRAERAPNMSELYATASGSAQFISIPNDPCRNNTLVANSYPGPVTGTTLSNADTTDPAIRTKLLALCSAQINAFGGNNASDFHANPAGWDTLLTGSALVKGNPDLKSEEADTWTLGAAFSSPSDRPLLKSITGTVDWYRAKVANPIEAVATSTIVNSCYNINGLNPDFKLNDPKDFCKYIERDPVTANITRLFDPFVNQSKLQIEGVDTTVRWSAAMSDLGFSKLSGTFSINANINFLIDQTQLIQNAADQVGNYAGLNGASKIRGNTYFTYSWGKGNRVSLVWQYRQATDIATTFATTASADGQTAPTLQTNPLMVGYKASNLFNLTGSTLFYGMNASLSISNLFNTQPSPGGYDVRDPNHGFGTFSPFDDLVGRRYSISLTANF